jgi:hypothetical protein
MISETRCALVWLEAVLTTALRDDVPTLSNCAQVCRSWNQFLRNDQLYTKAKEDCLLARLMPKILNFPSNLLDAFGGKRKICQLPIIDLGDLDDGRDYIDNVELKDLNGHLICRGETKNGRPFISFCYFVYHAANKKFNREIRTVFQRFPEDPSRWAIGGKSSCYFQYIGDEQSLKPIKEMFANKRVELDSRPESRVVAFIEGVFESKSIKHGDALLGEIPQRMAP